MDRRDHKVYRRMVLLIAFACLFGTIMSVISKNNYISAAWFFIAFFSFSIIYVKYEDVII